jgi:hypothetical protein
VEDRAAWLLIEEYYAAGDERFLPALREYHVPARLAIFTDRWKKDPRPWARQQILRYLELPLNASAHETVVKRLFKHAEQQNDDELMAAFGVAFDRLARRRLKRRYRYDWQTRQSWQEETLAAPINNLPTPAGLDAHEGPVKPQWESFNWPEMKKRRLFRHRTRYYLRRRAWRYFRRMGFGRPADYPAGVARMLGGYRDQDLASGENILDNWSLLHACFGESQVLEWGATHPHLREGRGLSELTPAPMFADLWKKPQSAQVLLDLIVAANARLVRVWAMQLLRREHLESLSGIPVASIRRLLEHTDAEVQLLGAELLEKARGLEQLTIDQWLELLAIQNVTALDAITRAMAKHVAADRLDLRQCVKLACAEPTPVARLAFDFLRTKPISGDADLDAIADLSAARCPSLGRELATWAMGLLAAPGNYNVERISRFFDSLLAEIRQGAWSAMAGGSPAWDDAALWSRLIETPYDDVRLRFVSTLQERTRAPGLNSDQLSTVWAGVLLGIQRGGRQKLIALRQISDAVRADPSSAPRLLPVLAVAIRSVRLPEARTGLAAVVMVVEAKPELAEMVGRYLPELQLTPQEAA